MNSDKKQHGKKWMPAMYVAYWGILQELANKHGYALCVHGSVVRDFDVIAVPFEPKVSPHLDLLADISKAIGFQHSDGKPYDEMGHDSHMRTCYVIQCGGGGYLDISFTPTVEQLLEEQKKDRRRRREIKKFLNTFPDISNDD